MSLIDKIMDVLRPELPVRQDIEDIEEIFRKQNPNRVEWAISHVYLCSGDLNELKQDPQYKKNEPSIKNITTYYAHTLKDIRRCKRVIVKLQQGSTEQDFVNLERKLKLDLYHRGCNAGILYHTYQKQEILYAEAIPAIIEGQHEIKQPHPEHILAFSTQ